MKIGGFSALSTIDYPGMISAVIFSQGCNLVCPYCHNASLLRVSEDALFHQAEIFSLLEQIKNKIEGVVVTGGEPTIHDHRLIEFLERLKLYSFKVKLDTNGTNDVLLKLIVDRELVDYVAVDFKTWRRGYRVLGCGWQWESIHQTVLKSIGIVEESSLPGEVRVTCDTRVVSPVMIKSMSLAFRGTRLPWYLQKVRPPGSPFDEKEMERLQMIAKLNIAEVHIR